MFYKKTQLSDESKKIFDDYKKRKSNCCNAPVYIYGDIDGTNYFMYDKFDKPWNTNGTDLASGKDWVQWQIKENNGIKIDTISKRVRVFKNDFVLEADIFQNGKITIINTQHHYDKHDDHSFKFIGSTPKTIKKIGELLIALSEIK